MSEAIAPRPGGGGRSVGGYDLVCEITRGVLGTLWVARATEENRPPGALVRRVPVPKNSKARDKIAEGAEWARHGNDARLPRVIEITPSDAEVAIAVPFVEGEPLRALLRAAAFKRESLGTPVAVRIAVETLELLHAVHERTKYDPMHRAFGGLQPDSIFVATDGLPRLLDVGVGVSCNDTGLFMKEAQWIAYLAPEQLSRGEPTAATDVFSVGAVLWEMLANRRLFAGATPDSVKQRVKDGPIQRLDELRGLGAQPLEKPIADVVARALERDPKKRYESAAAMSDALREVVKPAEQKEVAAAVERLASQFLEKRRAVLKKAGLELGSLDGRSGFIEREEPRAPARASLRPEADGSGGLSALTRQSTAGAGGSSRMPPPPPSKRGTSMPPSPPSARGSIPPTSRADRALALAKAASVAAPPPPRSVPPAASSSPPAATASAPPPPVAQSAPAGPAASAPPPAAASVPPRPSASVPPAPSASAPSPAVAPAPSASAQPPAVAPAPPGVTPAAPPATTAPASASAPAAPPVQAASPPIASPTPAASPAPAESSATPTAPPVTPTPTVSLSSEPTAASASAEAAPVPSQPAPAQATSPASPREASATPPPAGAAAAVDGAAHVADAPATPAVTPQDSGPGLEPPTAGAATGGPAGASDVAALASPATGAGGMAAMQTATSSLGSPSHLELEATTGSGMAAGIALDDDDLQAPFARRSGSRKGLFIGGGAVALIILLIVALSGGGDEEEPSVAAPPVAPAPAPAPVDTEPTQPAAEPEKPAEQEDDNDESSEGSESEESESEGSDDSEAKKEDDDSKAAVERPKPSPRPAPRARPRPRAVPRPRPQSAPAPAVEKTEPPKDVGASFKPGGI